MRLLVIVFALSALASSLACGPRVRVGGIHPGPGRVHLGTNESVDDKRQEWFQGLYRDCVDRHQAQACFKTGQNVEDGVVVPPSRDDAHWFYARACALATYAEYCHAAHRTDPAVAADHHPAGGHAHPHHTPSDEADGAADEPLEDDSEPGLESIE